MLGVGLTFVGIVLILNGICTLAQVDQRSKAIMNFFTGGLAVVISTIAIAQGNYYTAVTGLLFGFTYLFIALNGVFDLNPLPYAWFSTIVAVCMFVYGVYEGFIGGPVGNNAVLASLNGHFIDLTPDPRMAFIWWSWALLWFTPFPEIICGKSWGKFPPILSIFCGIFTAWVPAFMMLLNVW